MTAKFDVAVKVETFYIEQQSDPAAERYVFAYSISIFNKSDAPVQLLRRYWLITDANGKETEVEGEGVIGEQPLIAPNECYRYTSGAVLQTPVGTMQGYYEMIAQNQETFKAPIPLFRLAMPNILN